MPPGDAHGALERRWSEVVGHDVAAHARLVGVRDGVLTVAVDSPPWATQLRYLEAVLLERANAVVGRDSVHAISVRVRPETGAK
jgi:predicted nucleic acid-binding Zn ribbon protein